MYHTFCIHSSVDSYLGSIKLLALINEAAIIMVEHVSLLYFGTPLGYMPRSGMAGFYVVLCPIF